LIPAEFSTSGVMNSWNDPRARELKQLQLALATFALQLDAFELQTDSVLRSIGRPRDNGPALDAVSQF
jgi:hypothetical protein